MSQEQPSSEPRFEQSTYEKALQQVSGNTENSPALQERIKQASKRMDSAGSALANMSNTSSAKIADSLQKIGLTQIVNAFWAGSLSSEKTRTAQIEQSTPTSQPSTPPEQKQETPQEAMGKIREKLGQTTLKIGNKEIKLSSNDVTVKPLPNGNFSLSHDKLSHVTKTPLEIDKNGVIITKEVDINKDWAARMTVKESDLPDGKYRLSQSGNSIDIKQA